MNQIMQDLAKWFHWNPAMAIGDTAGVAMPPVMTKETVINT